MTFTDPATGRRYTVDPATGQSQWVDPPPAPPGAFTAPYPQQGPVPQQLPYNGHPGPLPAKKSGKGRLILGLIGGLVILVVIIAALAGGGDDTATTASGSPSGSKQAVAPQASENKSGARIGTSVRDGKFEFTVTGISTKTRVGNNIVGQDAQGEFLLVNVTVKNIGKESQIFSSSTQKLHDADDVTYSADPAAAIYLGNTQSFLNQINPGNSVKGILVFDIPKDAKPTTLELHDSPFSGGVEVSLTK